MPFSTDGLAITVAGVIAGVGVLLGVGGLIAGIVHAWRDNGHTAPRTPPHA